MTRTNKEYKDELTARQVANDNPFDSYVLKPEPGRGLFKQHPVLVPSMKTSRLECYEYHAHASKYSYAEWLDVAARMTIRILSGLSSTKVKDSNATAAITSNSLTMILLTRTLNPNMEWVLVLVLVPFIIKAPEYIYFTSTFADLMYISQVKTVTITLLQCIFWW